MTPLPGRRPAGRGMRRGRAPLAWAAALLVAFASFAGPSLVAAQTAQDPSNVVLVFDVSNSILLSDDGANAEFADVLEGIADRVEETASELAVGNSTMSFVVFGRTAVVYPDGCDGLVLHDNPANIAKLEDCLREIAGEYRAGRRAPVRKVIDTRTTDHVAALRTAASLLPDKTTRSAVIFFTDGQNDPPGTARDNENVVNRIAAAYEGRSPLAILPVGLGAAAGNFEPELRAIYDAYFRDMEPCEGRAAFSWPEVAFPNAGEAGTAVAQALQEVTCSFTFVPPPTGEPSPSPTPVPTPTAPPPPGAPVGVQLLAGNASITVQWVAPTEGVEQITGYVARCRPEQGTDADWKEVTVPAPGPTEAEIDGLEPGTSYVCEAASTDGTTTTDFTAAGAAIVVLGIPATPSQPRAAELGDGAARLVVDPIVGGTPIDQYVYECSAADGAKVTGAGPEPAVVVGNLVNGTSYTCVAYTENRVGRSAASVASASFSPCGNFFDCNPWAKLGVGGLVLAAIAVAAALAARRYLWRNRVWITAQVDGGENRSLGWGPEVGVRLQREEGSGWFALLEPFEGSKIRVRYRGAARFIVNGGVGIKDVHQGDPAPVRDSEGNIHQLIIRKYRRKPRDRAVAGRTAAPAPANAPAVPPEPRVATAAEIEETQEVTARIEGRDDKPATAPPPDVIG